MMTKIRADGNLFHYVMAKRGMNGKERDFPAICLQGEPMKSDEVLLTQAPPWVKERDKNRRKVRNHRGHLTSLRKRLLHQFEWLADNPSHPGDFEVSDDTGRNLQVLVYDAWAITYWADHAVKELRVVDMKKQVR